MIQFVQGDLIQKEPRMSYDERKVKEDKKALTSLESLRLDKTAFSSCHYEKPMLPTRHIGQRQIHDFG